MSSWKQRKWKSLQELEKIKLSFVSVNFGIGCGDANNF